MEALLLLLLLLLLSNQGAVLHNQSHQTIEYMTELTLYPLKKKFLLIYGFLYITTQIQLYKIKT